MMFPYLVQPNAVLWPRSGLGTDLLTHRWPAIFHLRETLLLTGEIPLWQGNMMGGLPLVGNPAVVMYYPPQFLLALVPIPILTTFALLNMLHLWIAGAGTYALGRTALQVNRPSAFIGGLTLMLTARIFSNMGGDFAQTNGLCLVPLCFLTFTLMLRRSSWRWAITTGFLLWFIYLLNFQFIVYSGWFIFLYFAYSSVLEFRRQGQAFLRSFLRRTALLLLTFIICVGLAAFLLLPLITYLPYQIRGSLSLADASRFALPAPFLVHTLVPIAYKFPEWELYAGLLPLVLAPIAFLHSQRQEAYFWLGTLLFTVIFSLGDATPLYGLMFRLPGFSFLRVPPRMWFFVALALALLTAIAVDYLIERGAGHRLPPRWQRWLMMSSGLLVLVTIVGRYFTRRPEEADWLLGFLAGGGLILGVIAIRRWLKGRLKSPVQFAGLLAAALCLDLVPLDFAFSTPKPFEEIFAIPEIAQSLTEEEGLFRIYSVRREIPDHVLVANGLESVDGLNSFQFAPYSKLMRIASGCHLEGIVAAVPPCAADEISQTAYLDAKPNSMLLGLLNTRYIIAPFELPTDEQLILREEVDGERLYENMAVLPRAFAVGHIELVADEAAMWSQLQQVDFKMTALIDPQPGITFATTENAFYQPAEIVQYQPNEILINVTVPDDGLLILGASWTPGWQAAIDGVQTPVLRVNGALRGVYVEAGKHQVRFYFLPSTLTIGLGITLITLTAAIISLGVGFFHWRQSIHKRQGSVA